MQSHSLMEALNQYLATLSAKGQQEGLQELNRFIQWCGRDRGVKELSPPEVAEYAGSAGIWGGDSTQKIKPVRSFLSYLKQAGMINISLAPHLKASKSKKNPRRAFLGSTTDQAHLTAEGHANLQSRLEILKEERIKVVADIQRAMADKDFRENAPLDAAKERQGFIESSIRELEGILANAVIADYGSAIQDGRVRLGSKITLSDLANGKEVRYTLVDAREADPAAGKISSISPVGKALMEKSAGEEVVITVPRGTLRYVVKEIQA